MNPPCARAACTLAAFILTATTLAATAGLGLHPAAAQVLNPGSGISTDPWPQGGFRLDVGVARNGQLDRMASPIRRYGTAPEVGLAYRRVGRATRFEVGGSFTSLHLASGGDDRGGTDAFMGTLRVQWLRRAARRTSWQAFLGARIDLLASVRRQSYPPDGQTELFGDLFVPLMAVAGHELRLTPRMVAWQTVAVPVAALVARSPYTGLKYLPDLELAGPGRLMGLDHVIGVDGSLGPHWSWLAAWRLSVLRYPDPRVLTLATHRWTFGFEVRP